MASVQVKDQHLVIEMSGIRKIWTLKSELSFPLRNVRGATVDKELSIHWEGLLKNAEWPGRKVLGTDLYGHYLGGTFMQDGDRVFWDVARPEKSIVITLEGADFKRLYIEVDDPEAAVTLIETALAKHQ